MFEAKECASWSAGDVDIGVDVPLYVVVVFIVGEGTLMWVGVVFSGVFACNSDAAFPC